MSDRLQGIRDYLNEVRSAAPTLDGDVYWAEQLGRWMVIDIAFLCESADYLLAEIDRLQAMVERQHSQLERYKWGAGHKVEAQPLPPLRNDWLEDE